MNFCPDKTLVNEIKYILRNDLKFPRGSGWVSKTLRNGDMVIYINKKLDMILKAPMCIVGNETSGITLPTVHLCFGWVLQPLCTFENRKEAYLELERKIGPEAIDKIAFDFHVKNVGRWKNVPFLFDW